MGMNGYQEYQIYQWYQYYLGLFTAIMDIKGNQWETSGIKGIMDLFGTHIQDRFINQEGAE